jgi:pimeloyl-ACP methyl ester carboxylesterase
MPYLRIGDADLYADDAGDGDPVLLLHGGFCSLETLQPQADALVGHRRVLAFERAGHGRSADTDAEYGYARGVADCVEFLDAVGVERADVIGYSDGAIIGLLLAMEHPERVGALVAISANLDPTGFAFSEEGAGVPRLRPRAESPDEQPDPEREAYGRLSPDGPEHADAVMEKLMRLWLSEPRIAPGDLERVTARTLVMSGDRDTIRVDHSLLIAASIPDAELCIVPGAGHDLVTTRPELIARIAGEFLAAG